MIVMIFMEDLFAVDRPQMRGESPEWGEDRRGEYGERMVSIMKGINDFRCDKSGQD